MPAGTARKKTAKPARAEILAIDERYIVPGLSRGLALLQLFTRHKQEQKLTEIAEGLGLSRSAAYRLVYTLEKDGFLQRDANTRRYRLTSKVLSLGFEFLHAQPLTEVAQPFLRQMSELTHATTYLFMLDSWEMVTLARVAPQITLVTNLQIGARFPAHAVAAGRVVLALLPEDQMRGIYQRLKREARAFPLPASFDEFDAELRRERDRGYVFNRSKFEPGISAIAAPIRDRTGAGVASMSIVAQDSFFDGGEARLASIVMAVAQAFSSQLGFQA